MPMPTEGPWPPKTHAAAYEAYRDWDAWFIGEADLLRTVYSGRGTPGSLHTPPSQRVRPSQYASGIIGRLSRWLWGAPIQDRATDGRLHIPLPADLAATAAGLLFSEPPVLTAKTKQAQDRIEELIADGLFTMLRQAAESASVFGDVYLRPVVDREVSPDAAIVSVVHADGAIPKIRWGKLVEVTFWSQLAQDGNTVLRLLEHHEPGRIEYGLFEGSLTDLGRRVPLSEHPDAAELAEVVDENSSQTTGLDRLAVVRIPNAGTQRRWRRMPVLKYLGRSDFDGNEPLFDRVDAVWTSWMRDIHLGRGRITVPAYMLEDQGPGKGAIWDPDREVYSAVNAMPSQQGAGAGITATQFAIRHAEHKATIDALVEAAMRHAGLSQQTLGEEGDVAMTATEAQNRERMSYLTRGDRIAVWAPAIAEYLELHLEVERAAGIGTVAPERVDVQFQDGVTESPEQIARTVQMLRSAEVLSIETGVRMVHPDWADEQVKAEVQRLLDEQATATAGMPGGEDPLATGSAFARANLPPDRGSGEGDEGDGEGDGGGE